MDVKETVRERDGYVCVECGMTNEQHIAAYGSSLQVHRKIPGGEYTLDGCETLCIPCHGPKPRKYYGVRGCNYKIVRLPEEWMDVVRKLAKMRGQPMTWFLISAIKKQADDAGILHPKMPWET